MPSTKKYPKSPAPAGEFLRASGKDGPQIVVARRKCWSDRAERVFLDALGASCNVTMAAAAAGFCKTALYRRRRDDPLFAGRWQAALEQGYLRLEMALVRRANELLEGNLGDDIADPDVPFADMTVRDAIAILQLHRAAAKREGARLPGWRARPRPLEEMRASILRKLEAIEAQRAAEEEAGRAAQA